MNDKLEFYNRYKETPFKGWNKINRAKVIFDDNTKIRRKGQDLTLQDFINENNKDCTIYQVLENYNGDKKLTASYLNTLSHKVIDDLAEVKDLPTAFEVMKASEKAWRNLPLQIRKEFNNDSKLFQKNGIEWANKKIAEYNKLQQKINEIDKVKTSTKEEVK